jgi:Icc-related predicted phosphoesterase
VRIAAIGDLHYTKDSMGLADRLLRNIREQADVLLLAGDLTNMGRVEEMEVMIRDLQGVGLPILAVVGNHDHQSDQVEELISMMRQSGICVLDCTTCEIEGMGFVGTKGFCGGFGRAQVAVFGERALKSFVQESIMEAMRLEKALQTLETRRKVALMHYSPIRETLVGETPDLFPFLGTSRLADVLDRFEVDLIFHGHAHHGSPQGRTKGGIPVHNVARFVQMAHREQAFAIHEIPS